LVACFPYGNYTTNKVARDHSRRP